MSPEPPLVASVYNACNEGRSRIESQCLLTADGQSCVRRIQNSPVVTVVPAHQGRTPTVNDGIIMIIASV